MRFWLLLVTHMGTHNRSVGNCLYDYDPPEPPWWMTAAHCGKSQSCGTYLPASTSTPSGTGQLLLVPRPPQPVCVHAVCLHSTGAPSFTFIRDDAQRSSRWIISQKSVFIHRMLHRPRRHNVLFSPLQRTLQPLTAPVSSGHAQVQSRRRLISSAQTTSSKHAPSATMARTPA